MASNVGNVGNIGGNNNQTSKNNNRPNKIKVKSGENLTVIAQRYGMSKSEFVKWTNLRGTIKVGQTITLPTATVEKGKGIYALAREYNMTMAEFAKMNGITDPQKYQAKEGEVFYVKAKAQPASNSKSEKSSSKKVSYSRSGTDLAGGVEVGKVVGIVINKQLWGSSYTPHELAEKLYQIADKHSGAVGRPDFDALISEINPKNVEAVLNEYTKLEDNSDNESLIFTITHEIKSKKQARKDDVMKVYDALAQAKNAPEEKRDEFKQELDEQFDSWGLVNTKKLDSIIDELAKMETSTNGSSAFKSNFNPNNSKAKENLWNPSAAYLNRKVKIKDKTFTIRELHDGAVASAKNDPGFSAVARNKRYTPRPYPYVNENGQIEAVSEVRESKNPNGPLKGKVVIINSGHGGYSPANGCFDSGTILSVKNAEGEEMPIEEWRTADMYAEELTRKLQEQGATVVFVNGAVRNGGMGATGYLEGLLSGNRGDEATRNLFKNTNKSDIAFMSLHVESVKEAPSSKKCTVRAFPGDETDNDLAKKVRDNVGQNIKELKPEVEHNEYYVLKAMGSQIPAVLVELGNIANPTIKGSLLSSTDKDKYTNALLKSLQDTLLHK